MNMRLNLRRYRVKHCLYPILILLWMILCGIFIKHKITRSKHHKPEKNVLQTNHGIKKSENVVLPTLLMACNKRFLRRTMNSLQNFRQNITSFPIIVVAKSPICYSKETHGLIKKTFALEQFTTSFLEIPKQFHNHYKYALNYVFRTLKHKAVIVLDDNLDISPDFFEYFLATYPLLKKDSSIWCVSAYNDNGKTGLVEVNQNHLLHRTDFFPGKGWMILSKTWDEVQIRMPLEFIENFLRKPAVTRGRVCIRPEISRTYEFGVYESNHAKAVPYMKNHRDQELLNTEYVRFTEQDLSYLLKENEHSWLNFVYSCQEFTIEDIKAGKINSTSKFVRVSYSSDTMFKKIANTVGLMDDFSHGVPRTGFYGIVQCFLNNHRVYLTPIRKRIADDKPIKKTLISALINLF